MDKKLYNVCKWASFVGLPAAITLVATLGSIWGWESTPQLIATLAAINTCMGAFIGVKVSKESNTVDGGLVVDDDYQIIDVVADTPEKKIAEGKTAVRLLVTKAEDIHYGN